jgi:folate-binding protein YgfZ
MAIQAPPQIESDYRLLREGAGAVERVRRVAKISGPDAVEFVQGQITNDVAELQRGEGCYALLLNPKGRILADLRVLVRSPEELWLESEPESMETAVTQLAMYKIGRRVELSTTDEVDHELISIIGPAARQAVALDPPPHEHAFVEAEANGAAVLAVSTDVGIDLIYPQPAVQAIRELVAPTPFVSEDVAEIVRIESGRPRFGIDMSADNLPGEVGLEGRAVSFTKGCYVGQEPVARMHHRGHPNRHLRGLMLSQPAPAGESVTKDSGEVTEVGRISSSSLSPAFGPIALAVLRREVELGEQVQVGGQAPAKVVRLPFGREQD